MELISAYDSLLQTRMRFDGTIQIGDVIKQRKEVLKTFFQLGETRGPGQALWIDVDETLTVEQVIYGRVTANSECMVRRRFASEE